MELLIPGLILVALMVYVSTRIKRAAERAFEAEQIDEQDFSIHKPDGFLHRIDDKSPYLFEAYSKENGPEPAADVRAATTVVINRNGTSFEDAVADEKHRLARVDSEERFELDGARTALIKGELIKDGHAFEASSLTAARDGRTFILRIEVLKELKDDFSRRTDEMLSSFMIK
jgi:hypothetical protein